MNVLDYCPTGRDSGKGRVEDLDDSRRSGEEGDKGIERVEEVDELTILDRESLVVRVALLLGTLHLDEEGGKVLGTILKGVIRRSRAPTI